MFSTVSIACESLPSMMLSLSSQVSPAVLSAMDDSDPAVCQQLWNAVLSVLKNITVRNNLSSSMISSFGHMFRRCRRCGFLVSRYSVSGIGVY